MTYQEEISKIHETMSKTGTTYSDVVKVGIDLEKIQDVPPLLIETINKTDKFLSKISDELKKEGLDHKILNIGILSISGHVRKSLDMKSKLMNYNGVGSFVILQGDGWFVRIGNAEFIDNNLDNRMFLEHIEVDNKCKGLGSFIMSIILDVCDEMNISLTCVPTDIFGKNGNLIKIRSWYCSLGFKKIMFNDVFYKYNPK
jgi:hypothetical protein